MDDGKVARGEMREIDTNVMVIWSWQREIEIERERERQTDRQTDRETEREAETETETDGHI